MKERSLDRDVRGAASERAREIGESILESKNVVQISRQTGSIGLLLHTVSLGLFSSHPFPRPLYFSPSWSRWRSLVSTLLKTEKVE
jgi:hypothetical protein